MRGLRRPVFIMAITGNVYPVRLSVGVGGRQGDAPLGLTAQVIDRRALVAPEPIRGVAICAAGAVSGALPRGATSPSEVRVPSREAAALIISLALAATTINWALGVVLVTGSLVLTFAASPLGTDCAEAV